MVTNNPFEEGRERRFWVDFVEKGGSCDADVTVIQSV